MSKKKESDSQIIKRLIKKKHPDAWLIEFASIGNKLITNEYGAFTRDGLTTYVLSPQKKLTKTGEMTWPREKHGEVDHFAIKSHFAIDGLEFVTGNRGKEVQKFLEREKKDSFTRLIRPFYQKILGFRSKKRWKQITATIGYLLILIFVIGLFTSEDDKSDKNNTKTVTTTPKTENEAPKENKKEVTDEQEQKETERLAEEQRKKEEADRLAEEKKKQEEAQRLAEEQKKQEEEAARLAEEQRQEEQRLAEEQDQQKEATNVYFKNCSAAKAAGAAPVYAGEPGYGKHLDRDGDGIGCDR